jgi:hypothetical protein
LHLSGCRDACTLHAASRGPLRAARRVPCVPARGVPALPLLLHPPFHL